MTMESMESAPQALTFEEFTGESLTLAGTHRYNNFPLHFFSEETIAGPIYRSQSHYQRFAAEHPEMNETLLEKIQGMGSDYTRDDLRTLEPDLYEAYKIMRSYGATDDELFA